MALDPYPLPRQVTQRLLELAFDCDVLLLGELHGTREVPRIVLGLLDLLSNVGYGGLALEIPIDQREKLIHWVEGQTPNPPRFFVNPSGDGRGNVQTLELVRSAVRKGWQILCFDAAKWGSWVERDRQMALNTLTLRHRLCPREKVLGICGNMHSRLEPGPGELAAYWPSFAAALRLLDCELTVKSVSLLMRRGSIFIGGEIHPLRISEPIEKPEIRDGRSSQHSLELHLPEATAATMWAET